MKKLLLGLALLVVVGAGCNTTVNNGVDTGESMEKTNPEESMVQESSPDNQVMEQSEGDSMMVDMSTEGAEVSIDLTGKNFEFSKNKIVVKKGQKVTVNFESTAGFHDFVVDEFNANTKQVNPGTKTSVTFTADKVGEFEYYCSVGQHRANGMVGTLVVVETDDAMEKVENESMMKVEVKADADVMMEKK
jgi:plastocyanin